MGELKETDSLWSKKRKEKYQERLKEMWKIIWGEKTIEINVDQIASFEKKTISLLRSMKLISVESYWLYIIFLFKTWRITIH